LPRGCHLISIRREEEKIRLRPREAAYRMKLKKQFINDTLRDRIDFIMKAERLLFKRYKTSKGDAYKELDLRPFVKSIDYDENKDDSLDIYITCGITDRGSIRVNELMSLLELDLNDMAAPIRRTAIAWN